MRPEMETRYRAYTASNIQKSSFWSHLSRDMQESVIVISKVLPFRTNEYVMHELIDWSKIPDDPIYRLTFPHPDMLDSEQYALLHDAIFSKKLNEAQLSVIVNDIRRQFNPHPAGQLSYNIPVHDGTEVAGVQHKYRQTVLFFPSAGQTCHAYCTFCFRWPQFIGDNALKIQAKKTDQLIDYLKEHKEVTDVLITGGDPLTMNAKTLKQYIDPLLSPNLAHIQNIRIGTKSLVYWPQRFTSDADADDLLKLLEKIVRSGKHLALMGHVNHPVELSTSQAIAAIKKIIALGAIIRLQSPIIQHINDNVSVWTQLWNASVNLGTIPYYMFVERDTGPRNYFKVPLAQALQIFNKAYQSVSGLARTVRGPSMSTFSGKLLVNGIAEINNEKVFVLQFIQARKPENVGRLFFAKYDENASWLDELKPLGGNDKFFFE